MAALKTTLAVSATKTAFAVLAGSPPDKTSYYYFKETSHSVAEFAQPFMELGGVGSIGFPITEPFVEQV